MVGGGRDWAAPWAERGEEGESASSAAGRGWASSVAATLVEASPFLFFVFSPLFSKAFPKGILNHS